MLSHGQLTKGVRTKIAAVRLKPFHRTSPMVSCHCHTRTLIYTGTLNRNSTNISWVVATKKIFVVFFFVERDARAESQVKQVG